MEIVKTIKLNIVKKGKDILCFDLPTISLVMGTLGLAGNLHFHKVRKVNNHYVVSIFRIKERIKELEARKEKIDGYLDIMKQVVRK